MKHWFGMFCALAMISATPTGQAADLSDNLKKIRLPDGFSIEIFAEGLEGPRQLALGDHGTVFAGTSKSGNVYAVHIDDGDNVAPGLYVIDQDLDLANGVAFRFGSLYVGALDRILRYDDIESMLDHPPEPDVVTTDLPDKSHHGRRYLRFGPDDFLYVAVGAPCNVCEEVGFAEILRMYPDGSGMGIHAKGVRNSVGYAFHPDTGEMWFTDNGRDMLGDDIPSDELNRVTVAGQHFGFPYCHQGNLLDPEFGEGKSCDDYVPPEVNLGPHVAALGLTFYTGGVFPERYNKALFIARHGSWNRAEKIGYDIAVVRFDENGQPMAPEVFASGWLQGQQAWGRPVDVLQLPDGSLLVSDDTANVIYRISYSAD